MTFSCHGISCNLKTPYSAIAYSISPQKNGSCPEPEKAGCSDRKNSGTPLLTVAGWAFIA